MTMYRCNCGSIWNNEDGLHGCVGEFAQPPASVYPSHSMMIGDLKNDLAHHKQVLAQRDRDWDALVVLIAQAVGGEDGREAADMGEMDEFDPWHALRTHIEKNAKGTP